MKKVVPVIKVLTIIVVIFFTVLTSARFLFSPLFRRIEYKMPGFPEDVYGFTNTERYEWAKISLDYLLSRDTIDYLEAKKLSTGEPLYNERELSHMQDVKELIADALITWYITIALLILFGLFAAEAHFKPAFWEAFSRGGLATLLVIVLLVFAVLTSFDQLFTSFHHLFFEGDTWLFNYSDTFIRLFPMRFWQDGFIFLGILSAVNSIIVFAVGRAVCNKTLKEETANNQK
jgi:integral membrane protein (TIGR01906 family)